MTENLKVRSIKAYSNNPLLMLYGFSIVKLELVISFPPKTFSGNVAMKQISLVRLRHSKSPALLVLRGFLGFNRSTSSGPSWTSSDSYTR